MGVPGMNPRCLVCNEPLSRIPYFDGWCIACAGAVLAEVLALRDGSPVAVGVRVAMLRDWGCESLARAITGVIPFDATPSAAELERLSDE